MMRAHPTTRTVPAVIRGAIALAAASVTCAAGTDDLAGEETYGACHAGKLELAMRQVAGTDAATGRDLRNFPPDRRVDVRHMRLDLRFEDLETPRFSAVERLTVVPYAVPVTSLRLDAVGLDIHRVTLDGASVEHFIDDDSITLRFDPPLAGTVEREIVFTYDCIEPLDGIFFTPTAADVPGYTAEVHTQGESISNRHWFIAHDSPDERMTTELVVDVPNGYRASSNGRLLAHSGAGGREIWHWLQDKPHVSYLVSLIIGRFDVVEVPHSRVPMHVWVPEGLGHLVPGTYGRTGAMIDLFERRFGVPYPWDRYDQLLVKDFGAGGMENTSATTLSPTAILDETALLDGDLDSLIAHELAHQWSGDLLTCRDWAHIWLNEGFATFGSALWFEERDGKDAYLASMRRSFGVARRDRTTDEVGMVSPVYAHPDETFGRRANPYPKGAAILHMLRAALGEEIFWEGIKLYMERHSLGTVETNDLRLALEEVSGRGLEWFFRQWCERPGCPNLAVTSDYDAERRELLVRVEQTQTIDDRSPAFRFTLPVHVLTAHGHEVHEIAVAERSTSFRATLEGVPEVIAVDPELHVLCTLEVEQPAHLWLAQARRGPTIVARHRAIEALGKVDSAAHRAILAEFVRDAALHESLRNAALGALRGFGSHEAKATILALADERIDDARIRVNVIEALGDRERAEVEDRLVAAASADASYAVRAAAIGALAKLKAKERADLIAELVHFPSQSDRVREAALEALAEFDDARGLDLGMQYGAYGYMDRSRPTAIQVVGKLAHHDPDRAVPWLISLLDDPCGRPARAAGRALAGTGDERAEAPLRAMAETHRDPGVREQASAWLTTLREKMPKSGGDAGGPGGPPGRRGDAPG
jgi:aminopeptidase N